MAAQLMIADNLPGFNLASRTLMFPQVKANPFHYYFLWHSFLQALQLRKNCLIKRLFIFK
jgi:hypothetical protein